MCGRTMGRGIDEVAWGGHDKLCQAVVFFLTNLFLFLPRFQKWQNHENVCSVGVWLSDEKMLAVVIVLVVNFVFFQQYC